MRVMHIGGFSPHIQALFQAAEGGDFELVHVPRPGCALGIVRRLDDLTDIDTGNAQIVHVHVGADSEFSELHKINTSICSAAQLPACFFWIHGDGDTRQSDEIARQAIFAAPPPEAMSGLFLPLPIGIPFDANFTTEMPQPQQIKVSYAGTRADEVVPIIEALRAKKYRFEFSVLDISRADQELVSEISGTHILIDDLDRGAYGALGTEAMARGKTVIAYNPAERQSAYSGLSCTAVHATMETLPRKLEGLIREPVSLRDLGKRSHQFAARFHEGQRIISELVRWYRDRLQ